jgi:hypothetical protein
MGRLERVTNPDEYLQGEAQSLAGILSRMQREGYTAQFGARPGATVMCFACRGTTAASRLDVLELRRLEGASDPADMLAVVAARCGHCGARGTLVLTFGPEAAGEDVEVLAALADPAVAPTTETADVASFVPVASGHFAFRFDDPLVGALSRCFGVTPARAEVRLHDGVLLARYGRWTLRTPLENVTHAEVTGPFSAWKVGGPARLSLADHGVTFATSRTAGVCISFADPVAAIDPLGLLRHPNLTVTVEQPELLCRLLRLANR